MSQIQAKQTVLKKHITNMFTHLDNYKYKLVYSEYDKLDKKLSTENYKGIICLAHLPIKAIALFREDKFAECFKLIDKLFDEKCTKQVELASPKRTVLLAPLYQDKEAITALAYFYNSCIVDHKSLVCHWQNAIQIHKTNLEYHAQLFMAQVRNLNPIGMKLTAQKLNKMTNNKESVYTCWYVISLLAEQAINERNLNNEDAFSEIAKLPPPAENKLYSNLGYKILEKFFKNTAKIDNVPLIKSASEAKVYLMANEASGNWQTALEMYSRVNKYLTGMEPKELVAVLAKNKEIEKADEAKNKENEKGDQDQKEQKDSNNNTKIQDLKITKTDSGLIDETSDKVDEIDPDLIPYKTQYLAHKSYRFDVCKCDLNIKLEKYEKAFKLAKFGINTHGADSWPFLLTLCILAKKDKTRRENVKEYLDQLIEKENAKPKEEKPLRGPYLAKLEYLYQLNCDNDDEILKNVQNYITKFATNIVLFEDIDKYLTNMVDGYPDRLKKMQEFFINYQIDEGDSLDVKRRTETAIILFRYRLNDSTVINDDLIENYKKQYDECLKDTPCKFPPMHKQIKIANSPNTALMANSEPYVGDAYLLIIIQYYLKRYYNEGCKDKNLVLECCNNLEQLLNISPSNQHIRLILVMLYIWELGAFNAGYYLMKQLDFKHVLCETLGYVLTRHCWHLGSLETTTQIYNNVIDFKYQSTQEAKDQIVTAFHNQIYDKVIEMIDYAKTMNASIHARYCEIESMFSESMIFDIEKLNLFRKDKKAVKSITEPNFKNPILKLSEQEILESKNSTLNFEYKIEKLIDSRDLGLFDDWKSDAIDRTRKCQVQNCKLVSSWLEFRENTGNLMLILEDKVKFGQELDATIVEQIDHIQQNSEKIFLQGRTVGQERDTNLPLQFDTEWVSYEEWIFNFQKLSINFLTKFQKFSKEFQIDEILSFTDLINDTLENKFNLKYLINNLENESIYHVDMKKWEQVKFLLEILRSIVTTVDGSLPKEKSLRKNLMKNDEIFYKNISTLIKLLNCIKSHVEMFKTSKDIFTTSEFKEYLGNTTTYEKFLETIEDYDYNMAKKVVQVKLNQSLIENVNRMEKITSVFCYKINNIIEIYKPD